MIRRSIRRHRSLVLLAAGVFVVVTIAAVNSLLAAIVLIVGAVLMIATVVGRKDHSSETSARIRPIIGHQMTKTYTWRVDQDPDLGSIVQGLNERGFGLRPRRKSDDSIVLSGGSQIRTRLLGGYFVDPKWLPVVVELKAETDSSGGGSRIELAVRDDFGVAVRDEALGDRFERAAGNLGKAVELYVEQVGGVRISALPQSAED